MKIPYNHAIYIRVLRLLYSCNKITSVDQNTYSVFKWYNIDAMVTAIRSVDTYARYVWILLNTSSISWTYDTKFYYLFGNYVKQKEKKREKKKKKSSYLARIGPFPRLSYGK